MEIGVFLSVHPNICTRKECGLLRSTSTKSMCVCVRIIATAAAGATAVDHKWHKLSMPSANCKYVCKSMGAGVRVNGKH